MLKNHVSTLLSALMLCAFSIGGAPAFAIEQADSSSFKTEYVAQNDQEESEAEPGESEEGAPEESEQQSEANGESAESTAQSAAPFSDLSQFMSGNGSGSGERVSLATLAVQGIGMVLLIVFLVAIPISFNCALCALIWKIGMVARGGKKPNIG